MVQLFKILRTLIFAVCGLALFGAAVRLAQHSPDSIAARGANTIAKVPEVVVMTISNLLRDPYAESLTPDPSQEPGSKGEHFVALANHTDHAVEGVVLRTGMAGAAPRKGWRMLYGIFTIDAKPQYGVLVLSPQMAIEKVVVIDGAMLERHHFSVGQAPYPHGFALLRDGSMLMAFDTDYTPLRVDPCGKRVWAGDEGLTHAFTPDDAQRFGWGMGARDDLLKVDLASGKTVREIAWQDIAEANPQVSIFAMRRMDDNALGDNPRGDAGRYYDDSAHINDAEPLPAAFAGAFPEFAAGDLLISMRSLNLVLVLDPRSLEIKWFTNDLTLRQHDADWNPDGSITVFDNQNGRDYSRIMRFDPSGTKAPSVALDGRGYDFYSRIRGKQQGLPGGGFLVTSSQQGRAFEVDATGRMVWELLVRDPRNPGRNFVLSEADFFPSDSAPVERNLQCPVS
ncbi:hypothetical protein HT136_05655 [Novosphingobium profundi]|uniref:arylsulfotransferase family protein n=1 Tax=Novosphingobium profundi TaxID=1774954 RepID=UPI001BD96048|nr:arylsulfotransferase family protein [Novosphingobium profundi]MBT0667850.1 hypothetical protein [Novosphingobium profundi]